MRRPGQMISLPREFYGRAYPHRPRSHNDHRSWERVEIPRADRPSLGRPLYDEEDHSGARLNHNDRARGKHRATRVPLQQAIDDLEYALEEAMSFYAKFKQDFTQEIAGIKAYANTEVIEYLWARKVNESNKPKPSDGANEEWSGGNEDSCMSTPTKGFRSVARETCSYFKVAVAAADSARSHRSSHNTDFDPQTAVRLSDRLKRANSDVFDLLRSASKRQKDMDALLTDLDITATFLKGNGAAGGQIDEIEDGVIEDDDGGYEAPGDDGPPGAKADNDAGPSRW